jgi:hypothetical protein
MPPIIRRRRLAAFRAMLAEYDAGVVFEAALAELEDRRAA